MAVNYVSYFDRIPKIGYDINNTTVNKKFETVTNVFFRIQYIQESLNNIGSYFVAEIEDGDTPEILAEKVYNDAGAAWMITLANQMVDPQWDWPLEYDQFQKYIIGKYGSIENAKTTYHHYDMVVTRTLKPDNIVTEKRYEIGKEKYTENNLTIPYNYYEPYWVSTDILADSINIKVDSTFYTVDLGAEGQDPGEYGLQPGSLAYAQYINNYSIKDPNDPTGNTVIQTIEEVIRGEAITNYDYEEQLNEDKRLIKIVRKEYYDRLQNEFSALTGTNPALFRRVV